jgi:Trk K+ transport system NAD-binding subunit
MPTATVPTTIPPGSTPTTPVTQPAPRLPSAPLARYLAHPGPTTARLGHEVVHVLAHVAATAGPVALAAGVAGLLAVSAARGAERRRQARGARLIEVLSPPVVDPEGAATLWTNLVALLRPAWHRVLSGQPHLGFELVASDAGLTISLWVPGGIPPGLVERAVEAAWPGARTETRPASPPLAGAGIATGGSLSLAAGDRYMLRTDHKVDPLRPLLGALAALGEGESACVQVLARPVTGRRLARLHKAATARRAGQSATVTSRLLDLVTPGPATKSTTVDPTRAADVADILAKAAQPCWAIAIRYAVATTAIDHQAKARLRGRAHAVPTAFALFAGTVASAHLRRLLGMERHEATGKEVVVIGGHPAIPPAVAELVTAGRDVVVVTTSDRSAFPDRVRVVAADPTSEEAVRRARPERASQVLVGGADDAAVLVSAVLVHQIAPRTPVIAIASSPNVCRALRDIGVEAVSGEELLAHTVAKSMEAPHAGELLLRILGSEGYQLREVDVGEEGVGHSLSEARERVRGVVLGAVHAGKVVVGVVEDPTLERGDRLLVLEPES